MPPPPPLGVNTVVRASVPCICVHSCSMGTGHPRHTTILPPCPPVAQGNILVMCT